jgi:two-component system, OmpR family, response regulator VanR
MSVEHENFIKNMQRLSILYIEDDPAVQKHISEFLKRYSKAVYLASDAENGYESFNAHRPDIVLLDINLPGMSGMELAEKIREHDTEVLLVMATAYTDKEFLLKAVELNLVRYLVKPITSDDLYDVFVKCIAMLNMNKPGGYTIDLGQGYIYNRRSKELLCNNEMMPLRKKEIGLLEFFLDRANEVVTYEMLQTMIWSDGTMTQDAIRSQIKNLRKKIHPKLFANVSGIGYKLQR